MASYDEAFQELYEIVEENERQAGETIDYIDAAVAIRKSSIIKIIIYTLIALASLIIRRNLSGIFNTFLLVWFLRPFFNRFSKTWTIIVDKYHEATLRNNGFFGIIVGSAAMGLLYIVLEALSKWLLPSYNFFAMAFMIMLGVMASVNLIWEVVKDVIMSNKILSSANRVNGIYVKTENTWKAVDEALAFPKKMSFVTTISVIAIILSPFIAQGIQIAMKTPKIVEKFNAAVAYEQYYNSGETTLKIPAEVLNDSKNGEYTHFHGTYESDFTFEDNANNVLTKSRATIEYKYEHDQEQWIVTECETSTEILDVNITGTWISYGSDEEGVHLNEKNVFQFRIDQMTREGVTGHVSHTYEGKVYHSIPFSGSVTFDEEGRYVLLDVTTEKSMSGSSDHRQFWLYYYIQSDTMETRGYGAQVIAERQ